MTSVAEEQEDYITHRMVVEGGKWESFRGVLLPRDLDAFSYGEAVTHHVDVYAYKTKSGRIWDTRNGWRYYDAQTYKEDIVTPSNIFDQASKIIYGDREKTYGNPAKNLEHIARQWALYLQQKYSVSVSLTPEDVCWMMADLKKCRQLNEDKHDNLLDAIGYIGLIDRIRRVC